MKQSDTKKINERLPDDFSIAQYGARMTDKILFVGDEKNISCIRCMRELRKLPGRYNDSSCFFKIIGLIFKNYQA